MPRFSDDDVLDFMVLEAIAARAAVEEEEAQKKADKQREKDAWKKAAATELPG